MYQPPGDIGLPARCLRSPPAGPLGGTSPGTGQLVHRCSGFSIELEISPRIRQRNLTGEVTAGDCLWRLLPPRCFLTRRSGLLAIKLTVFGRVLHGRPTPGTCAWPHLPSVPPPGHAVTSPANAFNWSTTILLMVVFIISRVRPFTSPVIFRDMSPRGRTAVVTSSMFPFLFSPRAQVAGHGVDRSGCQVFSTCPRPDPEPTAWPPEFFLIHPYHLQRATRVDFGSRNESHFGPTISVDWAFSFSCIISPAYGRRLILRDRSPLPPHWPPRRDVPDLPR